MFKKTRTAKVGVDKGKFEPLSPTILKNATQFRVERPFQNICPIRGHYKVNIIGISLKYDEIRSWSRSEENSKMPPKWVSTKVNLSPFPPRY